MKEINFRRGYYREGGSLIYNGEVKRIKNIDTFIVQKSPSIFDRKRILRIETEDGKTIEIEE